MINFKKTFLISAVILTVILLISAVAPALYAQTYTPLVTDNNIISNTDSVGDFIAQIYKVGVAVAVFLSVLMIILGGAEYVTSVIPAVKTDGKTKIQNALVGLLIALGSYMILYTIDPNLVSFNVRLDNAGVPTSPIYGSGGASTIGGNPLVTAGDYDAYQSAVAKRKAGQALTPQEQASIAKFENAVGGTTATANVDGLRVTHFGGMEDVRADASGRPMNPNGGTTWDETGSVSGKFLRNYDPNTEFYSAYPLQSRPVSGLPVFGDQGKDNRALQNFYLQFTNPATGRTVNTEIIDRGPGNKNASLDTSKATLNYLQSGNYSVKLVPKQGNKIGPQG
jgi:hypothetical protein